LLGTFVTITAYGPDAASLNAAVSAAFDEFRSVDAIMSIHRPDSELSRLNARATNQTVVLSPELCTAISAALGIARETKGAFDITVRPVADLWGFIWKQEYRFPTTAELDAVRQRVGFELIDLDETNCTVSFRRAGVSLDLGGIGKGYAVDRAIERLQLLGVTNAMVIAGGDLRVIGKPPGHDAWTVQLEDPDKRGARFLLHLPEGALSTSGDYENYFEHHGRRYSHILNPNTGMPVQGIAACTVVAPTCMESDAFATAAMILGVDHSLNTLGKRYAIRFTLRPDDGQSPLPIQETAGFPRLPR
jgi:thiamine biosynthesis lipoprotein